MVYDINGRIVRMLEDSHERAGEFETRWDARTDRGQAVANGNYIVTLQAKGMKTKGLLHVLQ